MLRLPPFGAGQRIGLFGGSFNPAHRGHYMVALYALKRLQLDWVWWLVSPQNPLKPKSSPFNERMQSAQAQARGAKMVVTDLEQRLGCGFTYETLRALKQLYPGVSFMLIMGADNLANFRKWRNWKEVAAAVPVAIVSRPGGRPAERLRAPRGWTYLNARLHRESSTAIRAQRSAPLAKPKRK